MSEDELTGQAILMDQRIKEATERAAAFVAEKDKRIAELESALQTIKRLCGGDRGPNWSDQMAVTQTRMRIMDLCEIANGQT